MLVSVIERVDCNLTLMFRIELVLFNTYFMFDWVIWHFHITSYLTDLGVFW